MANTTNYSWETPDDTDLVKDGAAAIRTLGTAIDTTVFNNASAAIAKTIVDAKGDIIAATAADTVARLAVGANDTVLTADSSTATGLKWAAPAGGGANWSLLNAGGTALTGAATITISGISGKDKIFVLISGASSATTTDILGFRINTDTGNNYSDYGGFVNNPASYGTNVVNEFNNPNTDYSFIGRTSTNATSKLSGFILITGCNSSGVKMYNYLTGGNTGGGDNQRFSSGGGVWNNSATVTSFSLRMNSDNFDAGTVFVYASA
jgi:hypothetical protein